MSSRNTWKQCEECLPVGVKVKDGTVGRQKREIKLRIISEITSCDIIYLLKLFIVSVQIQKYTHFNCTPVMYTSTKSILACILTPLAAPTVFDPLSYPWTPTGESECWASCWFKSWPRLSVACWEGVTHHGDICCYLLYSHHHPHSSITHTLLWKGALYKTENYYRKI